MGKLTELNFPADIDWRSWITRRDKMQDRYIPRTKEQMRDLAD